MKTPTVMKIIEIVGSPFCVSAVDGQKVFSHISQLLGQGQDIVLSFEGVERLTSAFLNVAIGQLYGRYNEELLRKHLTAEEISEYDITLLRRVVSTAKLYFKNPDRFNRIQRDVMGDPEDASG